MNVLADLMTGTTADLMSQLFGDFENETTNGWKRAANVEATLQAGDDVDYVAVPGCVFHSVLPELNTSDERRRVISAGVLLVPTNLELELSEKDRWQDPSDVIWRPAWISDDNHGFRHIRLTREDRQFSGQTGQPKK